MLSEMLRSAAAAVCERRVKSISFVSTTQRQQGGRGSSNLTFCGQHIAGQSSSHSQFMQGFLALIVSWLSRFRSIEGSRAATTSSRTVDSG